MAPLGFRTRDLCKIALFAVLVISTGIPVQGEPATQIDEKKTPSVKECRAHIDAALEQYWETTQPHEDSHQSMHYESLEPETTENTKSYSHDDMNNHEDDEDEDDTPTRDLDEVETETGTEEDEDETRSDDSQKVNGDTEEPEDYSLHEHDTVGEDDDEDADEDDEEEKEEEISDDVEEEEEQEEQEEQEEEQNYVTGKKSVEGWKQESTVAEEIASDSRDSEDEEDEEREENEEEDRESDAYGADNKDDEDLVEFLQAKKHKNIKFDNQGFDEQSVDEITDDDSNEEEIESEESEEIAEEEKEIEHKAEDDITPEEKKNVEEMQKVGENVEEIQKEEEDVEEMEEEERDEEETEKEETTEDRVQDTSGSEVVVQDDKATGESDSAESGMAPELSDKKSSLEQSQISEDTEEAPLDKTSPKEISSESPDGNRDLDEDDDEVKDVEDEDDLSDLDLDDEDEKIENIYEEDEDDILIKPGETFRSRDHVDAILGLDDIGTEYDKNEEMLAQSVFKEIKKIHMTNVKPMELLYKYTDSTTRRLGDAEIFSKPMILFLGPWNTGKTTILNYLLGTERTPEALKTGTGITDVDFTIITHGDQRQVISGTELAADWAYAGVQKFGQRFLEHFRAITFPHALLKKITLVDTPGILENRKNSARGYAFNDAFQWFIDRSDAIYVVLDPTKVDVGSELSSVLDQLKGRDVRFILNKADTIRRSDLMRVVGQLFWNLSPLMSSTEAPVIYAASLSTKPYQPSAPARFLADQEKNFLYDLRESMDKRVENKILYARRHAVRVRNHAKMVDCYLSTYYSHKSIFSSKKNVAKLITDNPKEYKIYEGLGSMTNVSRYDLPDVSSYREFFKMHPLYDFKPLVSTCSYFRGCPMDKLDMAITIELPELFARYKKAKGTNTLSPSKQDGR